MKSEEWIIGAGVVTLLLITIITFLAESIWEDDYHDAPDIVAGTLAPHRDGREQIACASCHVVLADAPAGQKAAVAPPPIFADSPNPHTDGREKMACKNCHKIILR